MAISIPTFRLFNDLHTELATDPTVRQFRDSITAAREPNWHLDESLIIKGWRVFVPAASTLFPSILHMVHTARHEGVYKTLKRLRQDFVIDHDRSVIRDFVCASATYQKNKTRALLHPIALLQHLEVPTQVWADISLDFVEGLPKVHSKRMSVILTVVDPFSKYAHFIALCHPYMAASVARAFFTDIVRLHGFQRQS